MQVDSDYFWYATNPPLPDYTVPTVANLSRTQLTG